jgi:hypothetical protein
MKTRIEKFDVFMGNLVFLALCGLLVCCTTAGITTRNSVYLVLIMFALMIYGLYCLLLKIASVLFFAKNKNHEARELYAEMIL